MINTPEQIKDLNHEFRVWLEDSNDKYPHKELLTKTRQLVETSDHEHVVIVPHNVEVHHVDGGTWVPAMVFVPCT